MLNSSLKRFPIFAGSKPVSAMGAATGLHVYQAFGAEAYRKYHNNLMTSAYVFFNNQRGFTLSDLDMVVNKSGSTAHSAIEKKVAMRMSFPEICNWGKLSGSAERQGSLS
ncbi:hypothetical protein [Enterobacter cloacae complex sp. 288G10]|uniref:hypothetical protein n=1 Tax=Enterobacter cloacae complex sp. 288G10 TaxID=3395859 RepID=UPI003CEF68DE